MIGPIVEHVRMTVDAAIAHYLGRLSVLIPVFVSVGFGVAAAFLILSEQLSPLEACIILAGAFLVIALVVAMIVLVQERQQRVLLRQSAQQSALIASLMTAAPVALAGGGRLARLVGLKAPLLIGSALLAAAMLGKAQTDTDMTS